MAGYRFAALSTLQCMGSSGQVSLPCRRQARAECVNPSALRRDYALEKAGWSVSEKLSYQKNFLTQIPRLGAGVFHSFNSHRPARHGPAQPFPD